MTPQPQSPPLSPQQQAPPGDAVATHAHKAKLRKQSEMDSLEVSSAASPAPAGSGAYGGAQTAPLETSRLYVTFPRQLPEEELRQRFNEAAPGLEYVSRPRDKLFVFVKYTSEAAARLALLRLNGKEVLGVPLRVSIAQPRPESRKRQRTNDASLANAPPTK
jgi:hypothetical protein